MVSYDMTSNICQASRPPYHRRAFCTLVCVELSGIHDVVSDEKMSARP